MARLKYTSPSFAPAWIALPPWGLHDCVVAVMGRDTRAWSIPEEQRVTHFPSSPYVAVSALLEGQVEVPVHHHLDLAGPSWCSSRLVLSGPQTRSNHTRYSASMHSLIVLLYPHAWQCLSHTLAETWTNRYVDASPVLTPALHWIFDGLWETGEDAERLERFFQHLLPLWRSRRSDDSAAFAHWRQTADAPTNTWLHWAALHTAGSGLGRSLRQVERRFKALTANSQRALNKRARAERAFFAAMEIHPEKKPNWLDLALACGYADQSHFIRDIQEVTGFTPEALHAGLLHEEAFSVYRAWSLLLGSQWSRAQDQNQWGSSADFSNLE